MSFDLQGCVCLEACIEWDDGIVNDQKQATASLLYTVIALLMLVHDTCSVS